MRYLVPVFLALTLVSSLALARAGGFYALAAVAQSAFYLAAAAGWLAGRAGVKSRLLALPAYFVLSNAAAVVAFYKFVRGERYARWEPIREPAAAAVARGGEG
jgi:hypothetical protein